MFLVAAITLSNVLIWIEVAIGLGLVIFVHELGHFAVAKLCGVKCEKFYLGFDIYGLKLLKFQWGETEYGIGILPLGGYVKMLGQEDNPTRAYEEMERAKGHAAATPAVETWAEDRIAEAEPAVYDPRSYLAQSVPKRMAIISAGVIMNLIFAFFMAALAYNLGVEYQPCIVSGLVPGQPAWRADMQVGDEILAIGDVEKPRYSDLMTGVALGNLSEGIRLKVQRADRPPFDVVLHPSRELGIPKIGILGPLSLKLREKRPVEPNSPADKASPALEPDDIIVAVDGQPVNEYVELDRTLARHADRPLEITVRRGGSKEGEKSAAKDGGEMITTTLAPNPVRHVGIGMTMGPVTAVQEHSPAAEAGLQPGDQIVAVDGQPVGDPMTLPDRLQKRAGKTVTFSVRKGEEAARDLTLEIPEPTAFEWPKIPVTDVPRAISGLGLAYSVLDRIETVADGSPAAKAGIKPGDELVSATLVPPAEADRRFTKETIQFDADKQNWVYLLGLLQEYPVGTKLELASKGKKPVTLDPIAATDWFNPERGLNLDPLIATRRAENLREAMVLGGRETLDWVLQVYRFLQKIGHQISPKEMGGPIAIAQTAGAAASEGFSRLLIFLVMLSANLAVLNFLPIPMLDGGHMVFLILEGIRRKPVSEKVVLAFHYAGFLFLISLMGFVFFLDFRRLLN